MFAPLCRDVFPLFGCGSEFVPNLKRIAICFVRSTWRITWSRKLSSQRFVRCIGRLVTLLNFLFAESWLNEMHNLSESAHNFLKTTLNLQDWFSAALDARCWGKVGLMGQVSRSALLCWSVENSLSFGWWKVLWWVHAENRNVSKGNWAARTSFHDSQNPSKVWRKYGLVGGAKLKVRSVMSGELQGEEWEFLARKLVIGRLISNWGEQVLASNILRRNTVFPFPCLDGEKLKIEGWTIWETIFWRPQGWKKRASVWGRRDFPIKPINTSSLDFGAAPKQRPPFPFHYCWPTTKGKRERGAKERVSLISTKLPASMMTPSSTHGPLWPNVHITDITTKRNAKSVLFAINHWLTHTLLVFAVEGFQTFVQSTSEVSKTLLKSPKHFWSLQNTSEVSKTLLKSPKHRVFDSKTPKVW